MALNFMTGNRSSETEDAPEATEPETETTNSAAEDDGDAPAPSRRRRGSRGGRGRSSSKAAAEADVPESEEEDAPAPRRASSRRRSATDDAGDEEAPARPSRRRAPAARASDDEDEAPKRPSRRRAPAARASDDEDEAPKRPTRRRAPAARATEDEQDEPKRAAPRRRSRAAAQPAADAGEAAMLDALKEQNEQLARLVQLQERAIERLSGNGKAGSGAMPRVGVFVDSANVELARDRSRGGRPIDWGVVLDRVTEGRRLVRAIAYSPVHDDPGVSRETQPLKRFADGSIKANVDIELALDVITMADRLDVAVLASGDGDFQHLVEVLQSRGVRVEVAGLGNSVAGNLKNAADRYIELDFAQKK